MSNNIDKFRESPNRPKSTQYTYHHGIDQAKSPDFMTVYIHALPSKKLKGEKNWLPMLRDVYRFHHDNYEDVLKWYTRIVCNKYYPTTLSIDITNNAQMGDSLINRFGKDTVDAQRFQNVGNTNTKYMLKQIGLDYLKMGYTFPNPETIRDSSKADIIRELETQMKHEQIKLTKSGRITFDHPSGKKNDNVHGWELSLKAVMDYQKTLFETDMEDILLIGVNSDFRKRLNNPDNTKTDGMTHGLSDKTYNKIMERFKANSNNIEITDIQYEPPSED